MTPGARHHGGSGSNEDMKTYSVYIMASSSGVLYIGITNDLERRAAEHKKKLVPGFSARYNVSKLVYFELFGNVHAAIAREKQLKGWLRKRKIALIESVNPQWNDLSAQSHPPIVRHSAPLTASQSKPVVARHSAPVTAPPFDCVLRDDAERAHAEGTLFLTNIQQLYERPDRANEDEPDAMTAA